MLKAIGNLILNLLKPKIKPTLKPCGTISGDEMSSILLDKLEEMKDDKADLFLADVDCKVYCKDDVKAFLKLDETDKIVFKPEEKDCDDIAAKLFAKFAGLIWTTKHALNWFIDEYDILWFIEPQTDKLSQTLEDWQGWDVRFFLSR